MNIGWNSWNLFACDIDEDLVRETAKAMVTSGLADVGYEYVVSAVFVVVFVVWWCSSSYVGVVALSLRNGRIHYYVCICCV